MREEKSFLLCANWKMYKNPQETRDYFQKIKQLFSSKDQKNLVFFPSVLNLLVLSEEYSDSFFSWGAQNCHFEEEGAFTGEISPKVLKQMGAEYCLVGHSERRKYFKESNADIQKKTKTLTKQSIQPIVCVGETKQERDRGEALRVVENQLVPVLKNNSSSKVILAYEPVWAIGTGEAATLDLILEQRENMESICYKQNKELIFLYGGSVNKNNIKEFSQALKIQGFLVGSASLEPDTFFSLYQSIQNTRSA